ncbi:unnamed protein product [Ilex paraguariensis]|uniref:Uncharacterized protein n=1 Tax=Ilex paraguariensis TaxID=185542 RepID=A0ABC8RS71_9AQUA
MRNFSNGISGSIKFFPLAVYRSGNWGSSDSISMKLRCGYRVGYRLDSEGGGEEAASGGDQGWGGAFGLLGGDEAGFENATGWVDFGFRVGVNVDVVIVFVAFEEEFPEWCEVEVCIGEEEERDFGLWVGGAKARDRAWRVERGECGSAEEREVVEFVR